MSNVTNSGGGGGGSGTVTSVSVVSANGLAGTVATATTTPAITLSTSVTGILKGNGTAISAAVADTDYQSPISITTTGTSGAATFSGDVLNIPRYDNKTLAAYSYLGNSTNATAVPIANTVLVLGTPGFTAGAGTLAAQLTGSTAGTIQFSVQNTSNNSSASTDFVVTADNGDDSTHFADFGINSSAGGAAPFTGANEAYLYTVDNKLSIAATGATGVISFATTGGTTPVVGMTLDANQQVTMSGNGAASVSSVLFNGTIYASGTGTTNFPKLFIQPTAASAATTWSTAGTQIGINSASGFAGNYLDIHANGGVSLFKIDSTGAYTSTVSTAASLSAATFTGTPFAGTGTTSFPLLYMNTAGAAAPTTFVTSGTYFGINQPSGGTADFAAWFVNGTRQFRFTAAGQLTASNITDGSAILTGGSLTLVAAGNLTFSARSKITSGTNGKLILQNNAGTAFTALQFGGSTSSFPGLNVNGTTLECKLADDSAYTVFSALSFLSQNPSGGTAAAWKFGSIVTATTALDTTRYLQVDVAGTLVHLAIGS